MPASCAIERGTCTELLRQCLGSFGGPTTHSSSALGPLGDPHHPLLLQRTGSFGGPTLPTPPPVPWVLWGTHTTHSSSSALGLCTSLWMYLWYSVSYRESLTVHWLGAICPPPVQSNAEPVQSFSASALGPLEDPHHSLLLQCPGSFGGPTLSTPSPVPWVFGGTHTTHSSSAVGPLGDPHYPLLLQCPGSFGGPTPPTLTLVEFQLSRHGAVGLKQYTKAEEGRGLG